MIGSIAYHLDQLPRCLRVEKWPRIMAAPREITVLTSSRFNLTSQASLPSVNVSISKHGSYAELPIPTNQHRVRDRSYKQEGLRISLTSECRNEICSVQPKSATLAGGREQCTRDLTRRSFSPFESTYVHLTHEDGGLSARLSAPQIQLRLARLLMAQGSL